MPARSPQDGLDPQVRRMYQRVLSGWARDALSLRRAGLDRPCPRPGPPGMSRAEPLWDRTVKPVLRRAA
jgi:hypothetical protein